MKVHLLVIAFLFASMALNAQNDKTPVIECFKILFIKNRFDTAFYSRKPHENISCFFALNDSISQNIINVRDFEYPYDLGNGIFFSIQPKNYLFVWGIDYFVRFTDYSLSGDKLKLQFEEVNLFGFTEKVIRIREVIFVKDGVWKLKEDSILWYPPHLQLSTPVTQ